jgi:hypothetical protein
MATSVSLSTIDRKSTEATSFAKLEPRRKIKAIPLSQRQGALPSVNWSPTRPKPVIALYYLEGFFSYFSLNK